MKKAEKGKKEEGVKGTRKGEGDIGKKKRRERRNQKKKKTKNNLEDHKGQDRKGDEA